jgi:anti-anti-sigma regulatory factor
MRSYFDSRRAKVIRMLLVTSNKSKQVLQIRFIGQVRPEEFQGGREDVTAEAAALSPGFRYLVDFSQLESMGLDCLPELGRTMELTGHAGAGLVVRVIPDPGKDIGMNILTIFHFPKHLKVVTCQSLTDAAKTLGL